VRRFLHLEIQVGQLTKLAETVTRTLYVRRMPYKDGGYPVANRNSVKVTRHFPMRNLSDPIYCERETLDRIDKN
jgi:hypothetical protein